MRLNDIESAAHDVECAAELARKAVEDASYKAGQEVAHYAIYQLQAEIQHLLVVVDVARASSPGAQDFNPFAAMDADPTAVAV